MFHWIGQLIEGAGGTALFRFQTSRALFAFIFALGLGLIIGRPIIHWLYRNGMRSKERKYQALDTGSKQGTPVMGGLILAIAGIGSALMWCDLSNSQVWVVLGTGLWFALIGAIDDYKKVEGNDAEKGLSRPAKLFAQLGLGACLGAYLFVSSSSPFPESIISNFYVPFRSEPLLQLNQVYLPFLSSPYWDISIVYVLGAAIFMGFMTNAVNFTDGLDGLTTVPCLLGFAVMGVFAYVLGHIGLSEYLLYDNIPGSGEITVLCSAMMGACLAFLWFNVYPADVFMGDSGSLMLGGMLGATALVLKQEVLMLVVGGVFVLELATSALQEQSLKRSGKRLFAAAPLHHLYQFRGIAESKIVVRLWIVSVLFAAMALATLKIR